MTTDAYCPRCGAALPAGHARVCPACHERVEALPERTPRGTRRPPPGVRRGPLAAVLAVVVGLAAAVALGPQAGGRAGGRAFDRVVAGVGLVTCAVLVLIGGAYRPAPEERP